MKRRTKVVAYAYIALHLAGGVASIFTPPSWRRPGIPAVVPEDLRVALPVGIVFAVFWMLLLRRTPWAWWVLTITCGVAVLLVAFGTLSVDKFGMSALWYVVLLGVNALFVTGLALWILEIPHMIQESYSIAVPLIMTSIIYLIPLWALLTDRPSRWRTSE